jgi:hypothetical protein
VVDQVESKETQTNAKGILPENIIVGDVIRPSTKPQPFIVKGWVSHKKRTKIGFYQHTILPQMKAIQMNSNHI